MGSYSLISAYDGGGHGRRPSKRRGGRSDAHKNARLDGMLRKVATGHAHSSSSHLQSKAKRRRSSRDSHAASESEAIDRAVSSTPPWPSSPASSSLEPPRKRCRTSMTVPMPDWLAATMRGESLPMMSTHTSPIAPHHLSPRARADRWADVRAPRPLYPSQLASVIVDHEAASAPQFQPSPFNARDFEETMTSEYVAHQLDSQPFAPFASPGPGFSFSFASGRGFVDQDGPSPAFASTPLHHRTTQEFSLPTLFHGASPPVSLYSARLSHINTQQFQREDYEIATPPAEEELAPEPMHYTDLASSDAMPFTPRRTEFVPSPARFPNSSSDEYHLDSNNDRSSAHSAENSDLYHHRLMQFADEQVGTSDEPIALSENWMSHGSPF